MRLVIAALGVGVISFFVYVLATLMKELISSSARDLEVYVAKFQPSRKRGELIEMNVNPAVRQVPTRAAGRIALGLLIVVGVAIPFHGQQSTNGPHSKGMPEGAAITNNSQVPLEVLQELDAMKKRIEQLEAQLKQQGGAAANPPAQIVVTSAPAVGPNIEANSSLIPISSALSTREPAAATKPHPTESGQSASVVTADDRKILDFLRDTTINVGIDTYYGYNFNNPVGRVNLLRAYDVLSNEFSLNQASLIFEHAPQVSEGKRWGGRLDLQYGQATETLQGNPSNEPRPQVYRNIFQAYGTYVAPVGKGLNIDLGKWGSSLGIEGNYTKDQFNYSRSYWFDFLPFYHMGMRASFPVNDRFSLNYWIVNGTNQVESTNGFKDELFGFTAKPTKRTTWIMNYYLGQEHADRAPATNCGPIPVQPGLCFTAISPAPNGRTHIFDSYVTWLATPKLTFALEGDYLIQRLWQNAAPGESSAPSHTDGGAGYIQYQFTPKIAVATRAEYLSDRGGLFSGLSQALKENTVTFDYKVANGFLMRYEWRYDYSNQPVFLSDVQDVRKKSQTTATLGLVWWWGRKEGSW